MVLLYVSRKKCPYIYGPNTSPVKIRKAEAVHKAKIQDWDLYDTAEEEFCRFIIDSVGDVWIAELKKKTTKYAEVKTIDMIRYLRKTALGTHKVDILELQDQMRELHLKVDSIPEYIEAWRRHRSSLSVRTTRFQMP